MKTTGSTWNGGRYATAALVLAFVLFVLSILPWLPPLNYDLWKLRFVAGELGGWWIVPAVLLSIGLTWSVIKQRSSMLMAALGLTVTAVILLLIPFVDAACIAQQRGISLSPSRYFFGSGRCDAQKASDVLFAPGLAVDIYRSKVRRVSDAINLLPAVVIVHGGGWNHGNKSDLEKFDHWLAEQGFVVFDTNYRLAGPSSRFPAQLDDLHELLAWLKTHAAEYGADYRNIALIGRSAGAHLALLAAYTEPVESPKVRAVVGLYGPTDLAWGYRNIPVPDVLNSRFLLENLLGGDPDSAKDAYEKASPLTHATSNSAPTLLIHGSRDHLVFYYHTDALSKKLADLGVPVEVLVVPGDHGFDVNFDGWASQIEQEAILRFLRARMNGAAFL